MDDDPGWGCSLKAMERVLAPGMMTHGIRGDLESGTICPLLVLRQLFVAFVVALVALVAFTVVLGILFSSHAVPEGQARSCRPSW